MPGKGGRKSLRSGYSRRSYRLRTQAAPLQAVPAASGTRHSAPRPAACLPRFAALTSDGPSYTRAPCMPSGRFAPQVRCHPAAPGPVTTPAPYRMQCVVMPPPPSPRLLAHSSRSAPPHQPSPSTAPPRRHQHRHGRKAHREPGMCYRGSPARATALERHSAEGCAAGGGRGVAVASASRLCASETG